MVEHNIGMVKGPVFKPSSPSTLKKKRKGGKKEKKGRKKKSCIKITKITRHGVPPNKRTHCEHTYTRPTNHTPAPPIYMPQHIQSESDQVPKLDD